ncbi:MAG: FAD-dependent oxidoreductase, partial [Lentisphaeria bacterium]
MQKKYIIIGSGIAGLSAALKIRSLDSNASITIFTDEPVLPYYRPTLTKQLGNDINSFNFFIKP